MNPVDRSAAETHWEYFLGLEDDLMRSSRYVDMVAAQRKVHSQFFTQIFITSCTEFEAVCKTVASEVGSRGLGGIADIKEFLSPIHKSLSQAETYLLRGGLRVKPFSEWAEEDGKLRWWTEYGFIKHARHTKPKLGCLENALCAMSALFVVNLVLANTTNQYERLAPSRFFVLSQIEGDAHPLFSNNPYCRATLSMRDPRGVLKVLTDE